MPGKSYSLKPYFGSRFPIGITAYFSVGLESQNQSFIAKSNTVCQSRKNPFINFLFVSVELHFFIWLEIVAELHLGKVNCIPELVAKLSITFDSLYIQIDIASLISYGNPTKAWKVCGVLTINAFLIQVTYLRNQTRLKKIASSDRL